MEGRDPGVARDPIKLCRLRAVSADMIDFLDLASMPLTDFPWPWPFVMGTAGSMVMESGRTNMPYPGSHSKYL